MPDSRNSFTLIELLIVIAIVAVLAVTVILTLNPSQLVKQARDSTRLSDLATINQAISLYQVDQPSGSLGTASTTYVSIADPQATTTAGTQCQGLSLPSLPSGWTYHCSSSSTLRQTNGTGWIPVNFSQISAGSPFSSLPIDPINSSSTGEYYTYTPGGSWKLTARLISDKQAAKAGEDGGPDPSIYETGTNKDIAPFLGGLVGWWKFDEGSGGVANDSSGYGTQLIVAASSTLITWQPHGSGSSLYYSPSASMNCINGGFGIYTNSVPAVIADLPQNAFTYAWWEEFSGNSTAFRLPTQWYWGIVDFGASITAGYDNENNKDQLLVYNHPSSGWHHMVYVFDYRNKSHSIYLDGKLNNTANNLNHSYGTINGIRIGLYDLGCEDSSAGSTFDDIHLYNRALSAAEIQALYNATK